MSLLSSWSPPAVGDPYGAPIIKSIPGILGAGKSDAKSTELSSAQKDRCRLKGLFYSLN